MLSPHPVLAEMLYLYFLTTQNINKMKRPMRMFVNQSYGLLLMACALFFLRGQALAGGCLVPVQIDLGLLQAIKAAEGGKGPSHEDQVLLANGQYRDDPNVATNVLLTCPVHSIAAPHACQNPEYDHLWNPAQRILPAEMQQVRLADVPPNDAGYLTIPGSTIPRNSFGDEVDGWTKVGVLEMNIDAWLANHAGDPNWMLIPLMTNIPRWAIYEREQPLMEQRVISQINFLDNMPDLQVSLDAEAAQLQAIILPESDVAEAEAATSAEAAKQSEQEDLPSLHLSAWPNPTTGRFRAQLRAGDNVAVQYEVCDSRGQVVLQQIGQADETVLDISGLAAGVYHLRAMVGQKVSGTAKIVLHH
jgi:Secretion system C-terminal sorting domain